ncbi:MAG: hypothetical protein J6Y29_02180 [Clostridiales bacterium]|nr:hypothetical protein [Clostridiales bacterium]
MKKIKWFNVIKLVILIASIGLIAHDFWFLIIGYGFTWFGLFTNIMAWFLIGDIIENFKEEIEKRPNHRN